MHSRSSRRVQAWFDLGARAFAEAFPSILPEHRGTFYVCPLCIHAFGSDAIDARNITLEDVPPKSMGGRTLVLTCKRCNNRAGSEVDAQMRRAENVVAGLTGELGRSQNVRMIIGDLQVNVSIHTTPAPGHGILITGLPDHNPPWIQDAFRARLEEATKQERKWGGFNLEFNRDAYRPQQAAVGWLRVAYLIAFAVFGYRYAFDQALLSVRNQLARPADTVIDSFKIVLPKASISERVILEVDEPSELRSLLVQWGRHVVFLPRRGDHGLYERLTQQARQSGAVTVRLHGMRIPWPQKPLHLLDLG